MNKQYCLQIFLLIGSIFTIRACELHSSWTEIEVASRDSVVQVFVGMKAFNWFNPYFPMVSKQAAGTGFFIDEDGYIATCAHVVSNASTVFVGIPSLGKKRLKATVISICPQDDIALLQLDPQALTLVREKCGSVKSLLLGDSSTLTRGNEILVLGYPATREFEVIKGTVGVLSSNVGSFLQYDAAANPGNSGGPVFSKDGMVVGICNSGDRASQGVNFAVPINTFKAQLPHLHMHKLLRINDIGIIWSYTTPEIKRYLNCPDTVEGFIICDVEPSKLAYAVGLRPDDIIVAINGYSIDSYGDIDTLFAGERIPFYHYIAQLPLGTELVIDAYRDGQPFTCSLQMSDQGETSIPYKYPLYEKIDYEIFGGLIVMQLTMNYIQQSVNERPGLQRYLAYIYDNGPRLVISNIISDTKVAQMRTIEWGDTINEVNGEKVQTLNDFRNALQKSIETGMVVLRTTDEVRINTQNVLTVLLFEEALQETIDCAYIYNYPLSDMVKNLVEKVDTVFL